MHLIGKCSLSKRILVRVPRVDMDEAEQDLKDALALAQIGEYQNAIKHLERAGHLLDPIKKEHDNFNLQVAQLKWEIFEAADLLVDAYEAAKSIIKDDRSTETSKKYFQLLLKMKYHKEAAGILKSVAKKDLEWAKEQKVLIERLGVINNPEVMMKESILRRILYHFRGKGGKQNNLFSTCRAAARHFSTLYLFIVNKKVPLSVLPWLNCRRVVIKDLTLESDTLKMLETSGIKHLEVINCCCDGLRVEGLETLAVKSGNSVVNVTGLRRLHVFHDKNDTIDLRGSFETIESLRLESNNDTTKLLNLHFPSLEHMGLAFNKIKTDSMLQFLSRHAGTVKYLTLSVNLVQGNPLESVKKSGILANLRVLRLIGAKKTSISGLKDEMAPNSMIIS